MSATERSQSERPGGPLDLARPAPEPLSKDPDVPSGTERALAGRYQLLDVLGRGGVGVVWRALDLVTETEVAVKELRLPDDVSRTEREQLLTRTSHEARLASRLKHHNVVHVQEVVNEDDRPWIVMELLPARTLAQIVGMAGPLPYQRVAEIGLQLISALQAAHDEGIVHRDVKPDNVMIDDNGRVVLTDFGLAVTAGAQSLTTSGRIVGSPAYIPPERARAGKVTAASDLWSLGATLYTAVEGHPPYDRKGYIAILRGDELSDPPPARSAGPLGPVLEGLLHVAPEDRLTASNATKMLRIAALAPSSDPVDDDGGSGGADDEDAEEPEPGDTRPEDGAEDGESPTRGVQLTHALQDSLHESVASLSGTVSAAFYRGSHARPSESVGELLQSIRESTDSLGLTRTGRHRGAQSTRRSTHVTIMAAVVVVALLTVVAWALFAR